MHNLELPPKPHKGWHSRGYLPHFDQPGLVQTITFRLNDALPGTVLQKIDEELRDKPDSLKRQRLEAYLDAGYGSCVLRTPPIATLVENAFCYFDGVRYHLLAWVVMPNHVHVLIEVIQGYPLGDVIHSWKSFTAKQANKILGKTGAFWQRDYFDRFIRDEAHFANVVYYIHHNPVKAGLVRRAEDWPFSSARYT